MFEIRELTVPQLHAALLAHETTCSAVVDTYLARMHAYQPILHFAITINDAGARQAARACDVQLSQWDPVAPLPPLFGVPIVLKDNFLTADMPTSLGSVALQDLRSRDAVVVKRLRDAGAIIMAKTNLHEFSLHGLTLSSLGGQTLNPYDTTRTPGGSSGGTAVALAANMALAGTGGDTMNSLRSPASACAVVGFRPTRGRISGTGVAAVSWTQDAIGPMARNVSDARIMFKAMCGEDLMDKVTVSGERRPMASDSGREPKKVKRNLRVGVVSNYWDAETENEVGEVMTNALRLISSIATLKYYSKPEWDPVVLHRDLDVQKYEYRTSINQFLESSEILSTKYKTLEAIQESGEFDQQAMNAVFYETTKPEYSPSAAEYQQRLAQIQRLQKDVSNLFEAETIDVLIYPHQRHLVVKVGSPEQTGRNGMLAALTGRPALCIPMGFSPPTNEAPQGIPVGLEILGSAWKDDALLEIGDRLEMLLAARRSPELPEM